MKNIHVIPECFNRESRKWIPAFAGMTLVLFVGCQTPTKNNTSPHDISAITTMTTGLTGQSISEDDMRKVAKQMQTDPEAKSAIAAIGGSFTQQPDDVKYCPVDGTRYSGNLTKCPKCGAVLKPVQ